VPDPAYSDADIDAAIAALSQPGRLRGAQELLARAVPRLHAILDDSLNEGGWFDPAHEQAVREATASDDPAARAAAVRALIADETRLGMFVGVAVGFELARELGYAASSAPGASTSGEPSDSPATPDPTTPLEE
jgi:hypothetical protein